MFRGRRGTLLLNYCSTRLERMPRTSLQQTDEFLTRGYHGESENISYCRRCCQVDQLLCIWRQILEQYKTLLEQ